MSSACLVVQQPSFGAVPWSRPRTGNRSSDTNASQTSLWRPWLSSRDEPGRCPQSKLYSPYSIPTWPGCFSSDGKSQTFQHPVRLFWPKSKSFDYLYSDGEMLLRNFPIQATISFYNESESENEDEDWEEDSKSKECLQSKSYFTLYK